MQETDYVYKCINIYIYLEEAMMKVYSKMKLGTNNT